MLLSVQILRAAAALLVLAFHVQHEAVFRLGFPDAPRLGFGAAGVDIFFVVSGFIMVWSTRDMAGQPGAARAFLARRLVRIVPLYWIMTTVLLVGMLVWPPQHFRGVDPAHLVASYLFLPWPNPEGGPAPFYGLGWTLNHEMFFYAVFAACLALPGRRGVLAATGILAALVVAGLAIPGLPFALEVWFRPIVLEFVAGALVALLRLRGVTLPGVARIALLGLGAAGLVGTEWLDRDLVDQGRAIVWGIPATLIMAGAVLGPEPPLRGVLARVAVLLGDASYSIYLTHFLVLSFSRRLLARLFDVQAAGPLAYALVIGLLAVGVSVAVHLLAERPVHRLLLRGFGLRGRVAGDHRPV